MPKYERSVFSVRYCPMDNQEIMDLCVMIEEYCAKLGHPDARVDIVVGPELEKE